jgi:hypothetical protein
MLIIPAELARKVDENRGDMTQADFIEFLIESKLRDEVKEPAAVPAAAVDTKKFATKEEMKTFEEDIKKLLKNFLDFFVGYGMELGKESDSPELAELNARLHELEGGSPADGKKGEGRIKWK